MHTGDDANSLGLCSCWLVGLNQVLSSLSLACATLLLRNHPCGSTLAFLQPDPTPSPTTVRILMGRLCSHEEAPQQPGSLKLSVNL